jgi:hypothetical protein
MKEAYSLLVGRKNTQLIVAVAIVHANKNETDPSAPLFIWG